MFFPDRGGSKKAKVFCADCPVIKECLQEAIALQASGNWAGTSEREREKMQRSLSLVPVKAKRKKIVKRTMTMVA